MNFIEDNIKANGVDIAYQLHGEQKNPILLLVHGLGMPLAGWPSEMVDGFVEQGFQVLLVDNRDVGKSQQLDHLAIPHFLWTLVKIKLGFKGSLPYQLEDMMTDIIDLLSALNIDQVHLVGASMGGMISQLIAIHHPERLLSLTSIMSTTGYKKLPPMDNNIKQVLNQKPVSSAFEERLNYHKNKCRILAGSQYPLNDETIERRAKSQLERGISAKGTLRQLLAILAAKDRTALLAKVITPTLVIHGDSDGLVHCDGGKETAKAINNSTLKIYPGMGHDFPVELIPNIVTHISEHAKQASEVNE